MVFAPQRHHSATGQGSCTQAFADFSTLTSFHALRRAGQTGCAILNQGSEEAYDRHRVFAEPLHIDIG